MFESFNTNGFCLIANSNNYPFVQLVEGLRIATQSLDGEKANEEAAEIYN
jgi:hypothetical protein